LEAEDIPTPVLIGHHAAKAPLERTSAGVNVLPGESINILPQFTEQSQPPGVSTWAIQARDPTRSLLAETVSRKTLLNLADLTTSPDGSYHISQITNTGDSVFISRQGFDTSNTQQSQECLQISLLPKWNGMESSRAQVIQPSHPGDSVKLVINSTAKHLTSFSTPPPEQLPLLVDRDIESLRKADVPRLRAIMNSVSAREKDNLGTENSFMV
jgi:hypothetical protein